MSTAPRVSFADARTVADWAKAGEATVYDVREAHEIAAERIPGTRPMPLSSFDASQVRPDAGTRLVLHCAAGVRCGKAAEILIASGYAGEIVRLQGGLMAWKANGLPTER
jgi:rhodanese-related sulfurtransferase